MSRENVDKVYRAFGAMQRGDIEEFVGYFHPAAEFKSLILEMEGSLYGHEGIRKWWAATLDAFPGWNPTILDVRDLDDWVLAHARWEGEGASSGVRIEQNYWIAVEIRDGLAVRYVSLRTEAEALAVVGLSE